ncbi:MAG: elongation factor G [Lachnospiraceae bacterium]|nr:elongation factor G [Lachnospiraceae bacterium]
MNVYKTDRVRNVVLLGHGGSGKTTLAESMAFLSGVTTRMGNVTDGNTISDYDKEEIKRKFSITTAVVPVEWKNAKINILDTPGFFDFVGEVEEAVGVADAAVIVVSGKGGVQVGTEKAWNYCEEHNIPRMFFVTGMDNSDVSYHTIVEQLQELYGKKIAPLHIPIHEGGKFVGYVNVVKKAGRKYIAKGKKEECPVPADLEDELETFYEGLMESVAETSEEFMERYFGGDEFTQDEIAEALAVNVADGSIIPICMGSPVNVQGIGNLLDDIVGYFPDPSKRTIKGVSTKSGDAFDADYDCNKAKSAYVWKTIADPFIGKYSLIKVCSGVLKPDDMLYDADENTEMRLGKIYVMRGNKAQEVSELYAGDIGALAKLDISTGDTLSTKAAPVKFPKTELSVPYTYERYRAVNKGDEDKVSQALSKLAQEDLTFKNIIDSANRQSLIYGIGDQQIDVIKSKLKERYKVDIELSAPKVAFRETIRKKSDVEGKYKKQTGGHGQYGHVKMRFEPSGNMEAPYEFAIEVVGGAVPKNYYPAVEKGLNESVVAGPLAAYPVVGVKATLYDGSYHPVDSSEQAFKTATHMAFKDGFMKADPILLEPIINLKVTVKDQYTGDVMGDLNKRRGRVLGMNPAGKGLTVIEADVPQMEIYGYSTVLRSMTGGSGDFAFEFARYEQAPADVQAKQVQLRADEVANGEE